MTKDHSDIINSEYRDFMTVHHKGQRTSPDGEMILIKKVGGHSTYLTHQQYPFE